MSSRREEIKNSREESMAGGMGECPKLSSSFRNLGMAAVKENY